MAFVDLEKAFDRVPRKVVWWKCWGKCLTIAERGRNGRFKNKWWWLISYQKWKSQIIHLLKNITSGLGYRQTRTKLEFWNRVCRVVRDCSYALGICHDGWLGTKFGDIQHAPAVENVSPIQRAGIIFSVNATRKFPESNKKTISNMSSSSFILKTFISSMLS